jgi:hypothetical protein
MPNGGRGRRTFIVRDNNGQQLAYVCFEEEPGRRSAAKLLSKDEARRIAARRSYCAKVSYILPADRRTIGGTVRRPIFRVFSLALFLLFGCAFFRGIRCGNNFQNDHGRL